MDSDNDVGALPTLLHVVGDIDTSTSVQVTIGSLPCKGGDTIFLRKFCMGVHKF